MLFFAFGVLGFSPFNGCADGVTPQIVHELQDIINSKGVPASKDDALRELGALRVEGFHNAAIGTSEGDHFGLHHCESGDIGEHARCVEAAKVGTEWILAVAVGGGPMIFYPVAHLDTGSSIMGPALETAGPTKFDPREKYWYTDAIEHGGGWGEPAAGHLDQNNDIDHVTYSLLVHDGDDHIGVVMAHCQG